jgi:hypothetical protein
MFCTGAIRVRGFQDPSKTLLAHGPRRVLRQQKDVELYYAESGIFFLERCDGSLEVLFGW